MPSQADILFGRIAVKNRLVDEKRVREYLSVLEKTGNGKGLGQLLVDKGVISASHFEAIQGRVKQLADQGPQDQEQRGGSARPAKLALPPTGSGVPLEDVVNRDFSAMAGQPIDRYLQEARNVGASDLHFQVDAPPFLRLHGQIVYLKHPMLTAEDTAPRIFEVMRAKEQEIFNKRNDLDFAYEAEHGRYRANVCRQRKGIDAVFRIVPTEIPSLESLHLPESLARFTTYRNGIVLLTGPAGCGKTATMAALIQMINEAQHDHIVTVEEPIEYVIESKNCNVNQRHVRVHTESFATALRSAMRADPDYICVGEMRDLETISMAITAAETGHLVFGTLHTTNAMRSVDRIIDVFPPKEQDQIRSMVSESLRGVVSQKLLPRADNRGREPAVEIMFATPAVAHMIREQKTFQLASVLQTGTKQGMVTMDDSINALLRKGLITQETAIHFSENPDRFRA